MWRTALASIGLAVLGYFSAAWLTHDFRVWTAEGARRLEVVLDPVAAPPVTVLAPSLGARPLPELLVAPGTATIVDFVYTRCVSVCAALGSAFQQMQQQIREEEAGEVDGAGGASKAAWAGEAGRASQPARGRTLPARVRLLSVSFDREHDDLATITRYGAGLGADPKIWRFATIADPDELAGLLASFQVVVIPDRLGGYEHNAALLVVDARGRLVRIFDYSRIDDAMNFARALALGQVSG